ncbi:MAG: hypothetical protein V4474_04270, partial [Patescibacteria group bacterium]
MKLSDLNPDERFAFDLAMEEQTKSTNPKWQVGAAAIAEDGTIVATHNVLGPTQHAEQLVLGELYETLGTSEKKLRAMVVVGAQEGQKVFRCDTPYGDDVELDEIECSVWLCGKCLEFMHDCTANVPDVDIILATVTGEILKTSLRSLYTKAHTSSRVPIRWLGSSLWPTPSDHSNSA